MPPVPGPQAWFPFTMAKDHGPATLASGQEAQISDTMVSSYKTWDSGVATPIPVFLVLMVLPPEIAKLLVAVALQVS